MRSLSEVSLTRSYPWGIVIMGDPTGDIPDVDPDRPVTVGNSVLVAAVRHEADVPSFKDDLELAQVEVTVRLLAGAATYEGRRCLFDGVIDTPSGKLSVGDANDDLLLSAHPDRTRVIVTVPGDWPEDDHHHESLWVDLVPPNTDLSERGS